MQENKNPPGIGKWIALGLAYGVLSILLNVACYAWFNLREVFLLHHFSWPKFFCNTFLACSFWFLANRQVLKTHWSLPVLLALGTVISEVYFQVSVGPNMQQ